MCACSSSAMKNDPRPPERTRPSSSYDAIRERRRMYDAAMIRALRAAMDAAVLAGFVAGFLLGPTASVVRAADPGFSQAAVDSLLEAERYDEVIALAQKELSRVERGAAAKGGAADSTILDLRSTLMFCHFQKGDYQKARTIQESIVEMRAKSVPESDPQRADDLNDLAMICDRLGDDEAAAQSWRKSLALLRAAKIEETAARIVPRQSALAETERRLGRIEESERLLVEAIAISEKHLPQDYRHARLLNNLGALLWDQRRFDEATRLLQEALRISEVDPKSTPLRIAVAHHNLANLKREQGDWAESERLHLRALAIAREKLTEDPQFPIFLKELAVLYADQKRFDDAFPLWEEALSKLTADPQQLLASEVLYERGRAFLENENLEQAEASLRQCFRIREKKRRAGHPMIGQVLAGLGTLEARQSNAKAARRDFERAVAILEKSSIYPEERAEAEEGLARLDWSAGRREAAVTRLGKSLDRIEDLRWERSASELSRADWIRRSADPTHVMLAWLAELNRLDQAVAMGERIRGRVLWDQMTAARVDWRKDVSFALRSELESKQRAAEARIRSLRRDLEAAAGSAEEKDVGALEKKLDAAVAAYRDVQEQSRAESPAWSRSLSDAPPADLAARVQKILAPGDLVLSYHVGAERSFVFEIPAQGNVRSTELLVTPALASRMKIKAGALSSSTLESILEHHGPAPRREDLAEVRGVGVARSTTKKADSAGGDFEDVADLLIPAAIRERIRAASRVHLIPDGVLHELPFEVLPLQTKDARPAAASSRTRRIRRIRRIRRRSCRRSCRLAGGGPAGLLRSFPLDPAGNLLPPAFGSQGSGRSHSVRPGARVFIEARPRLCAIRTGRDGAVRSMEVLAGHTAGSGFLCTRLLQGESRAFDGTRRSRSQSEGGCATRARSSFRDARHRRSRTKRSAGRFGVVQRAEGFRGGWIPPPLRGVRVAARLRSGHSLGLRDEARRPRAGRRSLRAVARILRGRRTTRRGEPVAGSRSGDRRAHELVLCGAWPFE